jgi:glycosyltransferase involved in cell wall biosynthesis
MSQADLSVIVTNYNKLPEEIEQCMQSIFKQTVAPKEIIFVDDCSRNRPTYRNVLSIVMPKNSGVAKARDMGVKNSTGKLLLFVDADDYLSLDFIQQCGKVITKCDVAYPNLLLFGEMERPILSEAPAKLNQKKLLSQKLDIPVTSMIFRSMYDKLGGFRDLPVFEDWDFWLRASKEHTFKKANTLLYYRQKAGSRNRQSLEIKKRVRAQIEKDFYGRI